RLGVAGLVQLVRRRRGFTLGRVEQSPEVEIDERPEALAAGIELGAKLGLGLVQATGHVDVLRALAGKEEGHRPPLLGDSASCPDGITPREGPRALVEIAANDRAPGPEE